MQLKSLEKCEKYVFLLQNIYPDAFIIFAKKKAICRTMTTISDLLKIIWTVYSFINCVCEGGGSTIYARSI